jgi:putative heme-binding domain-containing protein
LNHEVHEEHEEVGKTKLEDGGLTMAANPMTPWKFHLAFFVCFVLFVVHPAFAQPAPDPEIERRSFTVAEGFEVSLYAADPMMAKPIQMNFDPAGRLWVATSEIYPQIRPGQVADDKILVLEDTKGAARADRVTVFARGLLIPTAVLPGDGGAYVANSTEILHFKDTDGDGKADVSRVVLSGFGTEDTHHIIHTFRWGQDGIFYFNQSVYIHSHVETPYGPRRLAAGGTWAFRPETQELNVFTRGLINHWGHAWDKYADSFFTDGAGGEGVNYGFPGSCFPSINDQAPRIMHGLNPGSPKFAGAEIISGRHFPDDWQGDLITNDFRANRVVRFKLSEDGAGFASKLMPDVIRSTDKAFRPVDVKMGPDGALYIADWYNPIINHGEVDFRDPRRDKTHGRIWRLTAKGRPMVVRPKLAGAAVEALLEQLKAPEDYTRRQARLALREMDKETVVSALDKWVTGLAADDEFTRLQALWTYQTVNVTRGELVKQLLEAKDPGVRVAATRVLGAWSGRVGPGATDLLEKMVSDAHPRVRLEAVRALATVKEPRAMEVALRVLDLPMDGFLDYALYLTANDLAPVWLPEFQAGRLTFGHNVKQVEFVLKAIRNPDAIRPLVEEFRAGKVSPESRRDVAELIASLGRPEDLAALFDAAISNQTPSATRVALLQSLERVARQRGVKAKADVGALKPLLAGANDDAVSAAALRLAGAMKLQQYREEMIEWAENSDRGPQIPAGIEALADLGGSESVKALTSIAGSKNHPTRRLLASAALARLDLKLGSELFAQALAGYDEAEIDLANVLLPFLNRKEGPGVLGGALGSAKLSQDTAKLALRAVYALGHSEPALVDPLKAAAKIDAQPKQLTDDEMKRLLADVQGKGDAARGEAIFRRADTACLRCHSIAGCGGTLAPDLSSAGSAPVDYLIDSILLPSKAIKEGYHALIVETKDGDQLTGIKVRQTDRDLILRDAVQDEVVVPLDTIKGKPREAGSMMPAGLADPLTRQELVDLVRFLSELGRPGAYAVGPQQLARRWQVLEPVPTGVKAGQKLNVPASTVWMPEYSQVSGVLPVGVSPALARAQVNVTTPGAVRLRLSGTTAAGGVWVDDQAVDGAGEITLQLSRGVHSVTLLAGANAGLRLELTDAPNSPAKAQFVTGR